MKHKLSPHSALDQCLDSTSEDMSTSSIAAWPELKKLFMKLNALLPASAVAEMLVS